MLSGAIIALAAVVGFAFHHSAVAKAEAFNKQVGATRDAINRYKSADVGRVQAAAAARRELDALGLMADTPDEGQTATRLAEDLAAISAATASGESLKEDPTYAEVLRLQRDNAALANFR
jgi:hypothetical protein